MCFINSERMILISFNIFWFYAGYFSFELKSKNQFASSAYFNQQNKLNNLPNDFINNSRTNFNCSVNRFGPNCTFCVPKDSCLDGHYTCDVTTGNKYCLPGWQGEYCQIDSNPDSRNKYHVTCPENTCRNGGVCTSGKCCCISGFTGVLCEEEIIECVNNSCQNGGTCKDLLGYFECVCKLPYTGKYCENHDVNLRQTTPSRDSSCRSSTCFNNATCFEDEYFTYCVCPTGYTGEQCQVKIPLSPTTNNCPRDHFGADCKTICIPDDSCDGGHYICNPQTGSRVCTSGWIGDKCDTRSLPQALDTECPNNLGCKNDGQCFSGICCCRYNFTGQVCNIESIGCLSSPCQNNGSCIDVGNGYHCTCSENYSGRQCDKPIIFSSSYLQPTSSSVFVLQISTSISSTETVYASTPYFSPSSINVATFFSTDSDSASAASLYKSPIILETQTSNPSSAFPHSSITSDLASLVSNNSSSTSLLSSSHSSVSIALSSSIEPSQSVSSPLSIISSSTLLQPYSLSSSSPISESPSSIIITPSSPRESSLQVAFTESITPKSPSPSIALSTYSPSMLFNSLLSSFLTESIIPSLSSPLNTVSVLATKIDTSSERSVSSEHSFSSSVAVSDLESSSMQLTSLIYSYTDLSSSSTTSTKTPTSVYFVSKASTFSSLKTPLSVHPTAASAFSSPQSFTSLKHSITTDTLQAVNHISSMIHGSLDDVSSTVKISSSFEPSLISKTTDHLLSSFAFSKSQPTSSYEFIASSTSLSTMSAVPSPIIFSASLTTKSLSTVSTAINESPISSPSAIMFSNSISHSPIVSNSFVYTESLTSSYEYVSSRIASSASQSLHPSVDNTGLPAHIRSSDILSSHPVNTDNTILLTHRPSSDILSSHSTAVSIFESNKGHNQIAPSTVQVLSSGGQHFVDIGHTGDPPKRKDESSIDWWWIVLIVLVIFVLLLAILTIICYVNYKRKTDKRILKNSPEAILAFDKEHFSAQPEINNPTYEYDNDSDDDNVKHDMYIVNKE